MPGVIEDHARGPSRETARGPLAFGYLDTAHLGTPTSPYASMTAELLSALTVKSHQAHARIRAQRIAAVRGRLPL